MEGQTSAVRRKILVIDDEPEIVQLVSGALQRTGRYEVITATGGRQGLEMARTERPDLVLLDVLMPDMEGTEIAQRLSDDPVTRDIVIVFCTALAIPMAFLASLMAHESLREKAGKVGGFYFLQKPIAPGELTERLDAILAPSSQ